MQGKIALEEHFAIPDTLMDSAGFVPESYWPELKGRLLDIQDRRLAEMDRHGIEMMILSLNAPAVQAIADKTKAGDVARRANDYLAEQVANARRASRLSPRCRCRIRSLLSRSSNAASARSVFAAHWSTAFRKCPRATSRSITTCRNIGRFGRSSSSLAYPSICTRAIRCPKIRESMMGIPGCWGRPGRSARRPPSTPCA